MAVERATAKPIVLPDTFDGSKCWDDWISHFENVADVNEWDDGAKLKWMKVRLVGRAQKSFQHLGEEARGEYARAKRALRERFEPQSKQSLYRAEMETRRKKREEGWADFAEDLRVLSEKAYPGLQSQARECLAVNAYLKQISNPQVAFAVRQKQPANLDSAVTATLEMESYVEQTGIKGAVAGVQEETIVAATSSQSDTRMMSLMEKLLERVEKLELGSQNPKRVPSYGRTRIPEREARFFGDCWYCGKPGHMARDCYKRQKQGN